ncbi:transposase [Hyalangium rubrum]|uniref:Transposase n=1 Tax=Hyalangium rubrum TaxID=3103134 RepID=A0ABU5HAK8_9BACT|nr:transposase [Hyalangium sp. s54d21]MDY7229858.1 transposase [Hyalangium sp. s54d21]
MPRDPTARFKANDAQGLAAAEVLVPEEHLARQVLKLMERVEVSQVEAQYSALGQRGYPPRRLLSLWVYASLIGLHHATKLAHALVTDAALRLLAGGHVISRPVLNRFRMSHAALFRSALEATVQWALEEGLVDAQGLAVDSARLRAHASMQQVRVLNRSTRRLEQLAEVDTSVLSEQERAKHQQKVDKHTQAVELCTQAQAASVVLTSKAAALMQFPGEVYLPGHRLTVTASGAQSRLVVGVLINAAPNDTSLLEEAVLQARQVLRQAGLPSVVRLQAAADAGYWSQADLAFAAANTGWVDLLIKQKAESGPLRGKNYFGRDAFQLLSPEQVLCPVGKRMLGPKRHQQGALLYRGDGCATCPKHSACTPSKRRSLVVNWDYEKLGAQMRQRMSQQDAPARYHQRMATVEPVFSSLEDGMGFRRVSSRKPQTVSAEILLKLLAYNVSRLLTRRRLLCVYFLLPLSTSTDQPSSEF